VEKDPNMKTRVGHFYHKKILLTSLIALLFLGAYSALFSELFIPREAKAQTTTPVIFVAPRTTFKIVGESFTIDIKVDMGTTPLYAFEFYLFYDRTVLTLTGVAEGSFFDNYNTNNFFIATPGVGYILVGNTFTAAPPVPGPTGTGTLASLTFSVAAVGTSLLDLITDYPSGLFKLGPAPTYPLLPIDHIVQDGYFNYSPDFTISASPSSLTIAQGQSGTSTITVTSVGGFTDAIALSISGVPSGVTATFDPTSVSPPSGGSATSTLTLAVSASAALGTYPLAVTGTSGTLSHTTSISLTVSGAPDFSISASPTSLKIAQGSSRTSIITIASQNGFNSAVILSVSSLSGVTTTLSPTSVTPPPDGSVTSTLTVSVDASAAVGTYTLTVTGTSGSLSHTVDITLQIVPPPDFSISANPTSLTVVQGGSGTSTITVTSLNEFNSAVTLSVSGAPSGVTTSFSANPITPPSGGTTTSILTINVGASTALGTYTLTVTGTSGTLTHSVNIDLTVSPKPDFSISASPLSLSIVQGSSGTSTITITSLNGFNSAVSLSISGLPTGATAAFSPSSVTPPPNGVATSTLTISVGSTTPLGTHTLTVTGTSGTLTHIVEISLTVTPPPDFSLSADPTSLTIVQGGSGTSTITVTSLNDFSSSVGLSISGLPSGTTANFAPSSVTPPANGVATSTLSISVGVSTTPATYSLTVTGTSGSLIHTVGLSLTVTALPPTPDFSISASPMSLTIALGSSGSSVITVTSINAFSSPVSLSVSGAPAGVTTSFSQTSVTPPADGSITSTLTVTVSTSASPGTYTLTVTGTSGALSHTVGITLIVTAPDFSISASPTTLKIVQGDSGTSMITITSINGFSAAVSLSISGLPSGVTASFDPASVTPPADGSASSTLTVNVGATATAGTYTLVVTGTSGELAHSVNISLEVTPPPDFSMSAFPTSITIAQGSSGTSTITVTSLNDFNSAVSLSISGLPVGATGAFSPATVTPPKGGSATSTLTISVGATVTPGTYTLTVTGTSGAIIHTVDITLTITSFHVTVVYLDPATISTQPGQTFQVNLAIADAVDAYAWGIRVSFSKLLVELVSASEGPFLKAGMPTYFTPVDIAAANLNGYADLGCTRIGEIPGVNGDGILAYLTFKSLVAGESDITLSNAKVVHSDLSEIVPDTQNAHVSSVSPPQPDFSISTSPSSLTIAQDSSGTSLITVTSINGFSSPVDLTVSGVPMGVTTTFSATSITPPSGGSATSTLTVSVGLSAALGTYTLTVTGTSGTLQHQAEITLTITEKTPQPDFLMSASPTSLTIYKGSSATSTITVTSINGFSSTVGLSISGLPADVTASFNPASVMPPSGGSATSVLTVSVGMTAMIGEYTLTITGTSGALEHSINIDLEVMSPPVGDTTPPTITINEPQARDYLHSDSITLDFSAVDLESGVASISATLDGMTVTDGQTVGLYTLSLGQHTLIVTATDHAGNTATKSVTFNVIATIDSLINLVQKFFKNGLSGTSFKAASLESNDGSEVESGLLAKLYAAKKQIDRGKIQTAINILGAFMNQVRAQSGKYLSVEEANILTADAKYVIQHL